LYSCLKKGLITIKSLPQISRELGVPIATLRYRLQAYEDFIPYKHNNKGTKVYTSEFEGIICDINRYCDEKKTHDEIVTLLAAKYAHEIVVVNEPTTPTTNEQQYQNTEISRLNDNLEKLMDKMDRQQELQMQINEMRTAIGELSRVDRHKKGWFSRLWG